MDGRLPCLQHDGVAVRRPRTRNHSTVPSLALCVAMDANASSAGFSWNFPSSRQGTVHLRLLLEDQAAGQIALSDHWEPPWHDRSDPPVSVFLLDIRPGGLPGQRLEELVDVELDFDADARVATWSVVTTESDGQDLVRGVKSRLNVTRSANMSIGAGGINYLTVKAVGPGGICVATAHKLAATAS